MIEPYDLKQIAALLHSDRMPQCLLLDTSSIQNFAANDLRHFAQGFYCESSNACGLCDSCKRVMRDEEPDLLLVDRQDSTIKIADARALIEHLRIMPSRRVRMVAILDAENMSIQAANALLKTMEEPSSAAQFILTTDRLGSLPETVRSRCVVWRLKPREKDEEKLSAEDALSQKNLQEKIGVFLSTKNDAEALGIAQDIGAGLSRGLGEFLENIELFLNQAYKQGLRDQNLTSLGAIRLRRDRLQLLRKIGVQKKIALNINLSIECTRGMN